MKEGDDKRKCEKELKRLQQVADWCNEDGCRRDKLLSFFGESKPDSTSPDTCCCNCERRYLLRQTGGAAVRTGKSAGSSKSGSSGSFQSASGGVFSFRNRGGAAGGNSSFSTGGGRAFQFSRGTSMASTKFRAPRRLDDDNTVDGDNEIDQEGIIPSSSSFVFRGGSSFQSARWRGSHEGFDGGTGASSYSRARGEAEQPLRGNALVNAARARAEVGPSSFSSATWRSAANGGQEKKKKARTVDLF